MSLDIELGLRALIAEVVRDELRKLTAPTPDDEYLSTRAAASFADVSGGTIRRWIREGKLPPHRAGRLVRVKRSELERMMKDGAGRANTAKVAAESPEDRARRMFR